MDEDIMGFLEHFGIKGQRWGVRKKSKYFAPTTKSERKAIRRSASAKEGRRLIGNAIISASVGAGAGFIAKRLARKKLNIITSSVIGNAAVFAGGALTNKLLDAHGNRKI